MFDVHFLVNPLYATIHLPYLTKGGSRGISRHLRLAENHYSIFILRVKLNYTTGIAGES